MSAEGVGNFTSSKPTMSAQQHLVDLRRRRTELTQAIEAARDARLKVNESIRIQLAELRQVDRMIRAAEPRGGAS